MGVYKITSKIDGKVYIGQSTNMYKRKTAHFSKLKRNRSKNSRLQLAYNLYGKENLKFEFVEIVNNKDTLKEKENYWIKYFKSNIQRFGYNMTYYIEIENGLKEEPSEESKLKMSITRIGIKLGKIQKPRAKFSIKEKNKRSQKLKDLLGDIPISENRKQAVSLSNRGELNKSAKLTEDKVKEILELFKNKKMSVKEISDLYKVGVRILYNIRSGKAWTHITIPYINENGPLYEQTERYIVNGKKFLRLTESQAIEIINTLNNKLVTYKQLSIKYNVSILCISNIARGLSWTHIPRDTQTKDYVDTQDDLYIGQYIISNELIPIALNGNIEQPTHT